jgi:hypothetical protein
MKLDIEAILKRIETGMASEADARKIEKYITELEMKGGGLAEENKRLMSIIDNYLSKREE